MNRDHHIRAVIDVDDECEGVLASNGGLQGGYALVLHDGHLVYVSNYLGREHTVVRSPDPLARGRVEVAMQWRKTAPFAGDVTLLVGGDPVATGHVERTNPVIYAIAEGLEIGSDTGTPVWPGYESPFLFTGGIAEVVLGTAGAEHVDQEAEDRIARHVQ